MGQESAQSRANMDTLQCANNARHIRDNNCIYTNWNSPRWYSYESADGKQLQAFVLGVLFAFIEREAKNEVVTI